MEKEEQKENFRAFLCFKEHDIMRTIEQQPLKTLTDTFEGENVQTHYRVLGYEVDLYFHD